MYVNSVEMSDSYETNPAFFSSFGKPVGCGSVNCEVHWLEGKAYVHDYLMCARCGVCSGVKTFIATSIKSSAHEQYLLYIFIRRTKPGFYCNI